MSPNARGALFMSASMASFTLNDAMLKTLSDEMSMFQAVFLRGIGSTVLLIALAAAMGLLRLRLSPRDRVMVAVRTVAEIGAAYFFITALFHMPLANANAIMQALPLAVTLAGAVFLREPVGWRRLSAILVGFVGVMLIVRPGAEGFSIYSVYALAAVLSVTVRDLSSRMVSAETPSMTVAIAASVGVLVFAGLGCLGETWQPVSTAGWAALLAASTFIVGGYLFSILTMRVGDIAFIAPFRYTSLLWALLLGLVVFGDWPDPLTLAGAAIVVATGIFTFHRERKLARVQVVVPHAGPPSAPASVDNPGDSL
ncbi:DMT family transporter [Tropicimonas isoalkanivorans]|uniref:S-adenosylmethionine uptake transporter n=1 Tax=Tropicimonas isoalkanivorans TaxID=441112 RepID=A0A1I1KM86_9RHOB|nr:DMT family transporter [Tropicimonas isoalkanivorans]SFC61907.1 S-adenosylmethionine uptake transporter [Tropicimonas isoalkanivorans]